MPPSILLRADEVIQPRNSLWAAGQLKECSVIKMIAGRSILEFLLRVRRRRELRVIGASTLFDRGWYLRQYPDVRKAGIDEVMHYLEHGAAEGRDPGPLFDTKWVAEGRDTKRPPLRRWRKPISRQPGVNLIGPVEFISGLGTSVRGFMRSLAHAEIKLNVIPWRAGFAGLLALMAHAIKVETRRPVHADHAPQSPQRLRPIMIPRSRSKVGHRIRATLGVREDDQLEGRTETPFSYLLQSHFSRLKTHLCRLANPRGPRPTFAGATLVSLCLFAFLLLAFAASPVITSYDSRWSIHTAMSFAHGRGGDLTEYLPILQKQKFYMIEFIDGRPRNVFPIGTSLLAMPVVAISSWLRPNFADHLRNQIPICTEQFIASIVGATAGVLFFWVILSQFESVAIALSGTFILSFCTSMWSTATRALWQHGPLVLMLVITMLLLVRARRRQELIQYVSLPLAGAYLIRPTAIVPILLLSAYVVIYYRSWFLKYLGWAMVIAAPWLAYNLVIYEALLPSYYSRGAFSVTTRFAEGFLGNLISPSRGMLIFSPVLVFAVSGFVLALRDPAQRALHVTYSLIVMFHLITVGAASVWWAGHSFGPRFTTDIVPFLAYFTAFNFRLPVAFCRAAQPAVNAAIAILATASVLIHAQGALQSATLEWNSVPEDIDRNTSRAWDWSDPQFARTHVSDPQFARTHVGHCRLDNLVTRIVWGFDCSQNGRTTPS